MWCCPVRYVWVYYSLTALRSIYRYLLFLIDTYSSLRFVLSFCGIR